MLIQTAPVSPLLLSERVKGDSTVNALPELIVPVLRGRLVGHLLSSSSPSFLGIAGVYRARQVRSRWYLSRFITASPSVGVSARRTRGSIPHASTWVSSSAESSAPNRRRTRRNSWLTTAVPKGTKECSLQPHASSLTVRTMQKMGEGGDVSPTKNPGWGALGNKDSQGTGTPDAPSSYAGTRASAISAKNQAQTQLTTSPQGMTTAWGTSRQFTTGSPHTAIDTRLLKKLLNHSVSTASNQDANKLRLMSTKRRHLETRGNPLPSPVVDARRD